MRIIFMRSKYIVSKNLLERLKKKRDKIGLETLRKEIMIHIGGQERTIRETLQVMFETGLIKDIGEGHFKIK